MQIEIINTQAWPATDPKRAGQFDTLVTIRIDGKRNDVVVVPKQTNDPKELEKLLTAELSAKAKAIGHSFEIK